MLRRISKLFRRRQPESLELSLEAQRSATLEIVREVARAALAGGSATIEVREHEVLGPVIALEPRNPKACRVEIVVDEHQTDLLLGHQGICEELWEKDHAKRLVQLRAHLEAVVAGAYEETVEYRPRKLFFRRKLVATFQLPEGPESLVYYGPESMDYGPLGRTRYAPYDGDEGPKSGR